MLGDVATSNLNVTKKNFLFTMYPTGSEEQQSKYNAGLFQKVRGQGEGESSDQLSSNRKNKKQGILAMCCFNFILADCCDTVHVRYVHIEYFFCVHTRSA